MVDKRAHIAWVLRQKALPPDVVRFIFERELRPYWRKLAASARRALLRHIRVARLINTWLLETSGVVMLVRRRGLLIRQMTERWLLLGGRSARYIRAEQRHRYYNMDVGAQWGIGSAWDDHHR